jgi:hypothetical protein
VKTPLVFLALLSGALFCQPATAQSRRESHTIDWKIITEIEGKSIDSSTWTDAPELSREIIGVPRATGFLIETIRETSVDVAWGGDRSTYVINQLRFGEVTRMCQQMGYRRGFVTYRADEIVIHDEPDLKIARFWYPVRTPWYSFSKWTYVRNTFHPVNVLGCVH